MTATPTLFPFKHDWAESFTVTREWKTDVQRANDGGEVRAQLRANPSISCRMRLVLQTSMGAGRLLAKWRGATRPLLYYIPLWCDASDLTSAITTGDSTINCDTTDRPLFEDDGHAMIWRSEATNELVTIDTVSGSSFTITGTTTGSYVVAGTRVIPVRAMWLAMPVTVNWLSGNVAEVSLTFADQRPSAGFGLSGAATTATAASLTIYAHSINRTGNGQTGPNPYMLFVEAIVKDTFGIPIAEPGTIVWTYTDNEDPGNTDPNSYITIVPALDSRLARVTSGTASGSITATCGAVNATIGVN